MRKKNNSVTESSLSKYVRKHVDLQKLSLFSLTKLYLKRLFCVIPGYRHLHGRLHRCRYFQRGDHRHTEGRGRLHPPGRIQLRQLPGHVTQGGHQHPGPQGETPKPPVKRTTTPHQADKTHSFQTIRQSAVTQRSYFHQENILFSLKRSSRLARYLLRH